MITRGAFEPEGFEQFGEWGKQDRKVFNKILELIRDIQKKYEYSSKNFKNSGKNASIFARRIVTLC